jgi:hypothetical protein
MIHQWIAVGAGPPDPSLMTSRLGFQTEWVTLFKNTESNRGFSRPISLSRPPTM